MIGLEQEVANRCDGKMSWSLVTGLDQEVAKRCDGKMSWSLVTGLDQEVANRCDGKMSWSLVTGLDQEVATGVMVRCLGLWLQALIKRIISDLAELEEQKKMGEEWMWLEELVLIPTFSKL
ncbi:hypothetical protein Btru_029734 [Bulinus truncatus]|nr:hypothetical protein Btru_029734 [Bulinus truncatus]